MSFAGGCKKQKTVRTKDSIELAGVPSHDGLLKIGYTDRDTRNEDNRNLSFGMRPEQTEAVNKTIACFTNRIRRTGWRSKIPDIESGE
jgi:hypothetical protein